MKTDAWNVSQYEQFKDQRAAPFFDLVAFIDKKRRISKAVDLGSGTGELTQILHKSLKCKQTLGLDSSPAMLASAKKFEDDGLNFETGTIEEFKGPVEYDLIFSNAALQWCGDHPGLLVQLESRLKPGGQLALQMPMNHDYPTHLCADALARTEPYRSWLKEDFRQAPLLTPEEYATLLFHLGFKEQKVMMKVYGHVLASRDEVVEWVKGTLLTYYQSRLSAEKYQAFLNDYKIELMKLLPDEKPYFYPFKRVLIWARKKNKTGE